MKRKEKSTVEKSSKSRRIEDKCSDPFSVISLPNEVLLRIFRELPFCEFVRLRRVSRQFKDLCLANPPKTISLDFLSSPLKKALDLQIASSRKANPYSIVVYLADEANILLAKILNAFGSQVQRLKFASPLWRGFDFAQLGHCQHLNSLDIAGSLGRDLQTFADSVPKLTRLKLDKELDFEDLGRFRNLEFLDSALAMKNHSMIDAKIFDCSRRRLFGMRRVAELCVYCTPLLARLFDASYENYQVAAVKAISFSNRTHCYHDGRAEHVAQYDAEAMRYCANFPFITSISFSCIDLNFELFMHNIPTGLEHLSFCHCIVRFGLPIVDVLGRRFKDVRCLDITMATLFPEKDFSFLSAFPRLEVLRLEAGLQLSSFCYFPLLFSHLPQSASLSEAEFEGPGPTLNEIAQKLVDRRVRLRELKLNIKLKERRWSDRLLLDRKDVDKTLVMDLVRLSGGLLESLKLVGNALIDDSFLKFLSASGCDRMNLLDLSRCAISTNSVKRFLVERSAKIKEGVLLPHLHLKYGGRRATGHGESLSEAVTKLAKMANAMVVNQRLIYYNISELGKSG